MQDNYKPHINIDEGWNQMNELLNKEMPVQKKRRPFIFWLIGTAMLLSIAFSYFYFNPFEHPKNIEHQEPNSEILMVQKENNIDDHKNKSLNEAYPSADKTINLSSNDEVDNFKETAMVQLDDEYTSTQKGNQREVKQEVLASNDIIEVNNSSLTAIEKEKVKVTAVQKDFEKTKNKDIASWSKLSKPLTPLSLNYKPIDLSGFTFEINPPKTKQVVEKSAEIKKWFGGIETEYASTFAFDANAIGLGLFFGRNIGSNFSVQSGLHVVNTYIETLNGRSNYFDTEILSPAIDFTPVQDSSGVLQQNNDFSLNPRVNLLRIPLRVQYHFTPKWYATAGINLNFPWELKGSYTANEEDSNGLGSKHYVSLEAGSVSASFSMESYIGMGLQIGSHFGLFTKVNYTNLSSKLDSQYFQLSEIPKSTYWSAGLTFKF